MSNMDHDEIKWSRLDFTHLIIIIIMYISLRIEYVATSFNIFK